MAVGDTPPTTGTTLDPASPESQMIRAVEDALVKQGNQPADQNRELIEGYIIARMAEAPREQLTNKLYLSEYAKSALMIGGLSLEQSKKLTLWVAISRSLGEMTCEEG